MLVSETLEALQMMKKKDFCQMLPIKSVSDHTCLLFSVGGGYFYESDEDDEGDDGLLIPLENGWVCEKRLLALSG